MVTAATVRRKIEATGSVVVENPNQSIISRNIPRDIRLHHLMRALQVLQINQSIGRFTKTDFDTFVGPGASNLTGDTSKLRRPPGTTRRSLGTLTPEWAEDYLPFPGRIYFTSAGAADLWEAVLAWLTIFNRKAIRGSKAKNHPYKFGNSLSFWVDGTQADASSLPRMLQSAELGTTVRIVNVAPHAATVELWYAVMYDATRAVMQTYSPGIGIDYGFINSDAVGLMYGKGSGGPSRPGRTTPVVYALPMVTMFLPTSGRSNTRLRPFGVWQNGTTKGGKPIFRKRSRTTRTLR